jgi:hypothetical protein
MRWKLSREKEIGFIRIKLECQGLQIINAIQHAVIESLNELPLSNPK